jgi:ligand-binding sensor domain-containing protein
MINKGSYFHIRLLILFYFFCVQIILAQEISYRHINISEGLPSSEVYSFLQDRKGYLWISTDAGVCRFNGHKFTCFTTDDGLKDNVVFNLLEDKRGRIWMTCYNGAICYYENGKISSIPASDSLSKLLKNGGSQIYSLALDDHDTLWLGTVYSLIKIAPNGYKQLTIESSFKDSAAVAITVFKNKQVVISGYVNDNKIQKVLYTKQNHSYQFQCKGIYNFTTCILETNKYLGLAPRRCVLMKNGTLIFSNNNATYLYEPGKPIQKKSFENTIIFIGQDKNEDVWIGFSKGGVFRYLKGDMNASPLQYFPGKSVSYMLKDHEGGTWFSTVESGIYYFPMINYSTYNNNPSFVGKICGLDNARDKVFVLNNNRQVFMLNSNNTIDRLLTEKASMASRLARFYYFNGNFFATGPEIGKIDTTRKKIQYFYNNKGTLGSAISMVALDKDSYLLLGGNNISKLENTRVSLNIPVPSRGVCMLKTSDGLIHVGTKTGLYALSNDLSGYHFTPEYRKDSIFRQVIICMEQDKRGRLFLGTKQNGLLILKDGKYKVISKSNGLPSASCSAILPDSNETVWIGTNKGISLLKINADNSASVIATINTSHGLPSNEITRLARRGHTLYAGTKEGLCAIDVSQPYLNTTPPFIYISAVYMNKNPITPSANPTFKYDQNSFRFYVDCISFKNMFNPCYYYRLYGYDTALLKSSTEFIEYNNLLPGKYRLEVYGLNNNQVRSVAPAIYSFFIAKPFWLRWWFILLEIFFGAGIMFCFLAIRLKGIRKKEEEKTKFNTMILESQMTALRSQMNPHFIFNSINSIQNYILKENTHQAYSYLAKFSKLIRMVLSNSKENMLTLEQELSTLSLYVELEQLRFDDAFDFSIDIDKGIDPRNCILPGMLLQPFVENAIWHGIMPLEGKRLGKVMINIQSDAKSIFISIEDNGIGRTQSMLFNKPATHKSIGMLLSENRLAILNSADNNKRYGFHVEDLHDANNLPIGTKIIITIPILVQDEN